RDWGRCLDDEPLAHNFTFPVLPPGAMYDADHQCRLQYGAEAKYCNGIEEVCQTLWCRLDNKCVTKMEPAAEGTVCDKNKWCYLGNCTEMGDRPEAIDGEWGPWSAWGECSRTCGGGVMHAERHCDNPAPAHGGRYCIGERKRYRMCNTEECPEGTPSFRAEQCSSFNNLPYK
ncbi:A disintegrin and metalloproteinase with thrombospondin motifs 7-like, partial [Tropilaelaps mercedesae]